jgi:hypothetical protein
VIGVHAAIGTGTTKALEAAPCSAVPVDPAGTFSTCFQFRGPLVGTVNRRQLDTTLTCSGVTEVGGHIDAVIVLRGSGVGPLRASGDGRWRRHLHRLRYGRARRRTDRS